MNGLSTYYLRKDGATATSFSAAADGDSYLVTVAAATTSGYAAGTPTTAVQWEEAGTGGVVANVMKVRVVHGALAHLRLVDAIPRGEGIGARRLGVGPKEHATLHAERLGDAGHPERGGREIQQA